MRRRRTPLWIGTGLRPSARRSAAISVIASTPRPALGAELTSLTHASAEERWRRTAAWLTLAMNDDLIDANVLDLLVDSCVMLMLMSLLRLL